MFRKSGSRAAEEEEISSSAARTSPAQDVLWSHAGRRATSGEDFQLTRHALQLTSPPSYPHRDDYLLPFCECYDCDADCLLCREVLLKSESGSPTEFEARHPSESLPSIGSAGHAEGRCRPCAHVFRSQGCARGALCQRCHLCTQEEFLEYRHRVKAWRAVRRARASRMGSWY
eukprot:TRINITY_DN50698_c0_g1_i2.p1 TRINITY_DN50698_c0_g1~~TRINITY_DN50698_c0_g1_i2.p1  ORF type:complete len:173 (-),score=19.76 TRINITY_DN50698_c0_g1_i2:327-845(-)